MKIMQYGWFGILVGVALGGVSATLLPFTAFEKMASSLLVLFSILTGLLAQVMVFTAMIVTPERVPVKHVEALQKAFTKQQMEWQLQFKMYVIVVALCVSLDLFGDNGVEFLKGELTKHIYIGVVIAASCIAAIRSFRIPSAIIKLQHLRFNVIRDEMKARSEDERRKSLRDTIFPLSDTNTRGRFSLHNHGVALQANRKQ
ncbi:hypothetical protein HL658_29180 [Azospirillum sp. RWY-5-1]|uniref:Uncharacterized protein n=1 Tax=Azospirillum oleiclasticum TaxID=2735135 RepID=A0ABX2TMK3_9PROT|nr:hypothetical protein [Azospirillum oleiclasticum]NYZ16638.1 hypothetical protein [Azospirillum oleiclasticum]NYZ24125.1 hypothetical protein [Azospirillum oleiclasticum]